MSEPVQKLQFHVPVTEEQIAHKKLLDSMMKKLTRDMAKAQETRYKKMTEEQNNDDRPLNKAFNA